MTVRLTPRQHAALTAIRQSVTDRGAVSEPTLTRLTVDTRHPLGHRETHDLVAMHLRVVDAAQGIPVPEGGRLLWAQPRPGVLLIQTGGPVSGLAFPRGYLAAGPVVVDVTARLRRLTTGSSVSFGVVGNPVKSTLRRLDGDGVRRSRGQKRPLPVPERDGWLYRRLEPALTITDLAGEPVGCRAGRKQNGAMVSHTHHAWHGLGVVTNTEALAALVRGGIGGGKAYGLGLLIVAAA